MLLAGGAPGGGVLDRLTDLLLSTNPALAGRPAEARAAAGLRVRDRSLLLDNPPKPAPTAAQQQPAPPGYSARLRPLRAAGRSTALLTSFSSSSSSSSSPGLK